MNTMSQNFKLTLAIETLATDAQQLGISAEQLQQIIVNVIITIAELPVPQLKFTYTIQLPCAELAAKFDWQTWSQNQVGFTDYLWERTCLECFLSCNALGTVTTEYIEINVSPNGQYALYKFDDYRHPSYLPPKPLLTIDKKTFAHINWSAHPTGLQSNTSHIPQTAPRLDTLHYHYSRSFSIDIEQLSGHTSTNNINSSLNHLNNNTIEAINLVHPCVILKFDHVALYFASAHTSPPDFHQRNHWTRFTLNN